MVGEHCWTYIGVCACVMLCIFVVSMKALILQTLTYNILAFVFTTL